MSISVPANDEQDSKAIEYSLAELLELGSSSDQVPLSPEELREQSDVIVHGVIQSITPGRELYYKEDVPVPRPLRTSIFEVSVNYAEKGFDGDTILFEYIIGGIPAEILDAVKPDEQVQLFLRRSWIDDEDYRVVDAEGRTMGFDKHLYYPKRDVQLLEQLPRDRRYDISALLRERGDVTTTDSVDPAPRERARPEPDDRAEWDLFGEDSYYPENVRKRLEEE